MGGVFGKLVRQVKNLFSSEKVDDLNHALAQVKQQLSNLQQDLESLTRNLPKQIEQSLQKQIYDINSSKINSLEKGIVQIQQQITHLQQQLEHLSANIPNQTEEILHKYLTNSNSVTLSTPQMQLNKKIFTLTEEIHVSFLALSTYSSNAWIGIIRSDIPHGSESVNDQHDLTFQHLNGRTSGSLVFKAPTEKGSYDFRMHDTDSNGQEVCFVSFEVQ